ncbi:MAG: peptidylprolyl isomerase [Desulfobacterales bacterium]|nr:peptidylprolyl isomerase [Desulfobacterales bacterium]
MRKKNIIFISVILYVLSISSLFAMEQEDNKNPVIVMKTSMGDISIELFPKEAPKTVENFIGLAEGEKEFTDASTNKPIKKPFYDNLIFHRVIKNFMIQGGCPLGNGTGGPGYSFEDEINAKDLNLDKEKVMMPDGKVHSFLGIRSQADFTRIVVNPTVKKLGISNKEEFEKRKEEVSKKVSALTLMGCYENMGYKYNDKIKSRPPVRGVLAMANSGPNTNGSQFFINVVDTPWLTGKHTIFGKVIEGMDIVDKISSVPVDNNSKPNNDVKIISIRLLKKSK